MKQWLKYFILIKAILLSAHINHADAQIIINEIMANPAGLTLLPETEYVEIYNTSDTLVSLNNWSFIYDGKATSLPDTTLPANGYAVLYRSGRNIFIESTAMNLPIDKFPANLANTGKTVGLKNPHGIDIDTVTYTQATAARSWERDAANEWYLSTDPKGGTPGTVNSQKEAPKPPIVNPPDHSQPGDIIINEIMADPTGLTLLPETEYIEIYNTLDSAVPLYGWKFIYNNKGYTIPDTTLNAGQYAVLYKADKSIHTDPASIALAIDTFPVLANAGKLIGLKNSHGIDIDTVTYTTAKKARSWERSADNTWHLSTDPRGGTPGSVNSPKEEPEPPVIDPTDPTKPGDVIINEIMANPAGLTELPETEYIEIYNTLDSTVNLHNWKFIYDNKEFPIPDTILHAGQYAVLFRNDKEIWVNPSGLSIKVNKFPALANAGKTIGLKNGSGVQIDHVTYTKAEPARSWERDVNNDWYLSTDQRGGTPGSANSPKELPKPPVINPSDNSKPGDLIFNEIMANPAGLTELPETEYIELYNTSGSAISLRNWTFIYDEKEITLPDTIIATDSYTVIFRTGRNIHIENTGIGLPIEKFPANLANAGKLLQIRNSHNIIIDSVSYAPAKAARSWERDSIGNWYLSNDPKGGTPGTTNSPTELPDSSASNPSDYSKPGDVIINEVMANPTGLTQLPETEYIELYNTLNTAISLKGWSFIYDNKTIELPDTTIPPNTYSILFRAGREIHIDKNGRSLPLTNFPANLANTGKALQIKNSHNTIIDSIYYAAAKPGRAWERNINSEWYLSYDPRGGTPGSVNSSNDSIYPPVKPEDPDSSITDRSCFGDIIINEIMANPVGLTLLPETEYIELYNTSDTIISLKGWSFIYDNKRSIIADTFLLPHQYALLFRTGREIYTEHNAVKLPTIDFPANLANTGKALQLKNSLGIIIDSTNYKAAKPARSWERDKEGYWYLSNDPKGGTPGTVNSSKDAQPVEPGNPNDSIASSIFIVHENELIINELLPEPFTGGNEYIELYNRSERALSLSNLSIATRKADGSLSTHYSLKSITDSIYPDGYIALTSNRNGVLDFYYTPVTENVHELKLPTLNNTGSTIVLFRSHDEFVIDQLTYSAKWHDVAIKNMKGVSLERIDPHTDTQSVTNWTSATSMAGYGTPGYRNSQWNDQTDDQQTVFINAPEYNPAFNEYIISYQTDEPGYRCRIEVYTIEGRKVAGISNNQLLSTTGEIRWDGYGSDGSRLNSGLYIFYAELYHPNGVKNTYKKVFLVQ